MHVKVGTLVYFGLPIFIQVSENSVKTLQIIDFTGIKWYNLKKPIFESL